MFDNNRYKRFRLRAAETYLLPTEKYKVSDQVRIVFNKYENDIKNIEDVKDVFNPWKPFEDFSTLEIIKEIERFTEILLSCDELQIQQ